MVLAGFRHVFLALALLLLLGCQILESDLQVLHVLCLGWIDILNFFRGCISVCDVCVEVGLLCVFVVPIVRVEVFGRDHA